MKSVFRILAASSALFLILSPAVLAAPLAQEADTTSAESEFPDGFDSNVIAGKFGEPYCDSEALEVVCIAGNAGAYCSHDGFKVRKDGLQDKCAPPRCWCA